MTDDEIFCAALELASSDQQDLLIASLCRDDSIQLHRIQQLFHVYRQTAPGDQSLASSLLERAEEVYQAFSVTEELQPGQSVDRYVLVKLIGEGATSLVYSANPCAPTERQVALKLLRPGMDSQRVRTQFALELQLIQSLAHPGITRVFDAGVQENGCPYFAMELIPNAMAITRYADEFQLDLRSRMGLMISVCDIVQHAHQRGIIHRDLKPSNVLLEGVRQINPMPKIIDFGIAKVLRPDEEFSDSGTALGEKFGTPAYMSPEQALMPGGGVDIRSDVYSLGVILYELLTGCTPRSHIDQTEQEAYWTLASYWNFEVPRPSQRLANSMADARPRAPAELDFITMRALARDRSERYQTVVELAKDLQRFLDTNQKIR